LRNTRKNIIVRIAYCSVTIKDFQFLNNRCKSHVFMLLYIKYIIKWENVCYEDCFSI